MKTMLLLHLAGALASGTGYDADVAGTPIEFVCAYRRFALEYARAIGHDGAEDQAVLHDALQLTALCNDTRPAARPVEHAVVPPATHENTMTKVGTPL